MKKNRLYMILLYILFPLLYALVPSTIPAADSITKKYTYNIYWLGLRGGKAELEYITSPDKIIIKTHATSAPFISLFYKVDDRARSTLDADGNPQEFVLKTSEGTHTT